MATIAAKHNGGRLQTNTADLQIGMDYQFLNRVKSGQPWRLNDGTVPYNILDVNGYLTSTPSKIYATRFFIPSQIERSGNWVIKWNGIGTVFLGMAVGSSTGSLTNSSGNGRFVFTPANASAFQVDLGIQAVGSPYITNLVFVHEDDEAAYDAGDHFTTLFKNKLTSVPFGVIRMNAWQCMNTEVLTRWAHRKSISYISWCADEWRPSLLTTATLSGSTFTAAAPSGGFDLADKDVVQVRWPSSITGSAPYFLNVGAKGAIEMIDRYCHPNYVPVPNSTATLIYDATLNKFIAWENMGLNAGVPPEVMVQLGAEVGAHIHVVAPVYAAETNATDYWVTGFATYCRDNAPSWMKVNFEGPNELWNYSGGVNQVWYATAKQLVINGGNAPQAVSAFTYPSALSGAGFADVTFTSAHPYIVGSDLTSSGYGSNGISNLDGTVSYVSAINVGGNTKKITIKVSNGPSGTYSGSGASNAGYDGDTHNFYGRVMVQMGQALAAVYGSGDPKAGIRCALLCGVQTSYGFDLSGGVVSDGSGNATDRAESPSYFYQSGHRACEYITKLMIANYYTPSRYGTLQEIRNGFNYSFTANTAQKNVILADYVDSNEASPTPTQYSDLPYLRAVYAFWRAWCLARSTPILKVSGYEGGYSPDFNHAINVGANAINPSFFTGVLSSISGVSKANPCVLTLNNTYMQAAQLTGDGRYTFPGDNAVVAGMQLDLSVLGMTQLNSAAVRTGDGSLVFTPGSNNITWTGSTPPVGMSVSVNHGSSGIGATDFTPGGLVRGMPYYVVYSVGTTIRISATKGGSPITITSDGLGGSEVMAISGWRVLSVSGQNITLDVDSSSFSTWTSGGAQWAFYDYSEFYINILRYSTKTCTSSNKPNGLEDYEYQNYTDFVNASGNGVTFEYPSQFLFGGNSVAQYDLPFDQSIWSVLTDIYMSPLPPRWKAGLRFSPPPSKIPASLALRMRLHS